MDTSKEEMRELTKTVATHHGFPHVYPSSHICPTCDADAINAGYDLVADLAKINEFSKLRWLL